MFLCYDLGELKSFSQGAKFPSVEDSSLNQWTVRDSLGQFLRAVPNLIISEVYSEADILFSKCQTSVRTGS